MKVKKITTMSSLLALAIIINLVESYFIPPLQFGIRIGLANIVALITITIFGSREMIALNLLRVLLANLLRGSIFSSIFWISLSGTLLSSLVLTILSRVKSSIVFKSIMSSIANAIGQILFVMYLYQQVKMINYLPVLLITSLVSGIFTGIISGEILKRSIYE